MSLREAATSDIPQIQIVRHAVKENRLSDPLLVTDQDVEEYILHRGKGWVYEVNNDIVGFSIVDLKECNVWALFIIPEAEGKGIGSALHDIMVDHYFQKTDTTLWLGTSPNTRAESFYRFKGWSDKGLMKNGERRFEMNITQWKNIRSLKK